MENKTMKVLDATVISADIKEIKSVNIIESCLMQYDVVVPEDVKKECERAFGKVCCVFLKGAKIYTPDGKDYESLKDYLKRRYPYLHSGDLSSILVAALESIVRGRNCYFVTDDGALKKVVESKLPEDEEFHMLLGKSFEKINVTGTIGLLRRLNERKILSCEDIIKAARDIPKSSFRATKELVRFLKKGCKDEA